MPKDLLQAKKTVSWNGGKVPQIKLTPSVVLFSVSDDSPALLLPASLCVSPWSEVCRLFNVIQEVIQCSELNYFWVRLSNFRKQKWLLFKVNFKNVILTLLLEVSANIVRLCSCCACTMRSQLLQNSVWHVAHVTESGSSLPTTNENENWNQYWYKKAFR